MYEIPSLTCWYISMNMNKEPFNNPLVREALSYAIDRQLIIDTINAGSGEPADAIIAPGVFGYYSTGVREYDPEKAKDLLAEAGYPDGFTTSLWVNDNQSRIEMCQAVQNMFQQIGVECCWKSLSSAALSPGPPPVSMICLLRMDYLQRGCRLHLLLPRAFHPAGAAGNRSFIADPEVDALIEEPVRIVMTRSGRRLTRN